MPVKMFQWQVNADAQTLEHKINAWLEEHPDLFVSQIVMSPAVDCFGGTTTLYACVYYQELVALTAMTGVSEPQTEPPPARHD